MTIGFLGSMTGIFLHSFTDFSLKIPANAILLAILLALCLSALNISSHGKEGQRLDKVTNANTTLPGEGGSKEKFCIHIPGKIKPVLYACTVILSGIFIIAAARPAIAHFIVKDAFVAPNKSTKDSEEYVSRMKYAVKLDPLNGTYPYRLGKLYTQEKTLSAARRAVSAFEKAVALNPVNSRYHQSLAWTYGQLALFSSDRPDNYENKAHHHFKKAIALEPNNAYRHRAYALWLFNHPGKRHIHEAVKAYKNAVKLKPNLAKEAMERYYHTVNDPDVLHDIIPDTLDGHLALYKYVKQLGLQGTVREEEKVLLGKLSNEISKNRNDQETYKKAGRIYQLLKKHEQAIEAQNT